MTKLKKKTLKQKLKSHKLQLPKDIGTKYAGQKYLEQKYSGGRVKIERALSKLGLATRSQTLQWIKEKRLKMSGVLVVDPSKLVVPEKTRFFLDELELVPKGRDRLYLYYKPKGEVCTFSDEKSRRTALQGAYEALKKNGLLESSQDRLIMVGRLDLATEGLLLLTNSNRLSQYLTDPRNQIERKYLVTVRGDWCSEYSATLETGVKITFDTGKIELARAKKVDVLKISKKESLLKIELTEGKNREIRRLVESLNKEVLRLKRISFGPYVLHNNLEPGQICELKIDQRHLSIMP